MDLLLLNNPNLNIILYEKRFGFGLRMIHRNLSISQSAMGITVFIVFIAMTVVKNKQDLALVRSLPCQSLFLCFQISSLCWAQETDGTNDMAIASGQRMTEPNQ